MCPNRQRLFDHRSTPGALLGCVAWIHRYDHTTSVFRKEQRTSSFVRGIRDQLIPGCIRYAFCQTMILKHVVNAQIFKGDHAKTIHPLPTQLMSKVLASVDDPLVDMLNCFPSLRSFRRSFFSLREFSLGLRQFLLVLTEETRVGNFFAIRESRKAFQSNIHSDCQIVERHGFDFHLASEAGIPIAHRISLNGERLDPAFDGTMLDDLQNTNFGNQHTLVQQFKTRLLEGETIVSAISPKTWIAWFLASFHSTKETLECQIDSFLDILQYLRMDTLQFRMLLFPKGEQLVHVVQRKGFLFPLPGIFASGQRLVEYPTTKFQRPIEFCSLAFGKLEAILESFHPICRSIGHGGCFCILLERTHVLFYNHALSRVRLAPCICSVSPLLKQGTLRRNFW